MNTETTIMRHILSLRRTCDADGQGSRDFIDGYNAALMDAVGAILDAREREDAGLPAETTIVPARRPATRVTKEDVLHYLMDHEGSAEVCYILRDLYKGHVSARVNVNAVLKRLHSVGDVSIDYDNHGNMVRATLQRWPGKED